MHTSKNIPRTTGLETFLISVDIGDFRVHTASLASAVKLELAAYRRAGEVRAVELYCSPTVLGAGLSWIELLI